MTAQPDTLAEFSIPEISAELAPRNGHGKRDPMTAPAELATLTIWLLWKFETRKGKPTKVPYQPNGMHAKTNDAGTWSTLAACTAALSAGNYDGIGLAFGERLAGIDFDNCFDPEQIAKDADQLANWARAWLELCPPTYTELSPSGRGLHLIYFGELPEGMKGKRHDIADHTGIETYCYPSNRYFTFTGNPYPIGSAPRAVATVTADQFVALRDEIWPQSPTPAAVKRDTTAKPITLDDLAVVTRAQNAGNGAKFSALWGGSIAGYKSASEADQALVNMLAFWTRDAAQIERLWLSSGLRADDPKIDRPDYRARTIAKALTDVTTTYDPNYHAPAAAIGDDVPAQPDGPAFDGETMTTPAAKRKPQPPTDDELADRWKANAPLTAFGLGDYRRYGGGIWPTISEAAIDREIKAHLIAAKPEGLRPTASRLASVRTFARLSVHADDQEWDADPDLLVLKNGTLHIPTRELRPHNPDDRITSGLDFDYQSYADAPMWKYALDSTVPDAAEFLQEFAGYCFTTDTRHEIALWLLGPRGSGKSTIIGGIAQTLGTRAGVLGLASIERSQFALSALPGKTLITATEQPSTYMRSVHVLNAIISGEPVTIERKHENAYTLTPHAKLLWSMNELPRVGEASSGLFRRVKVIKFPALSEDDRDPEVKETIKNERAGILNWALIGLDRLRKRGRFEVPQCVKNATAEFESTNDVPALYVADNCLVGPNFKAQAGPLYTDYKRWCEDNGHKFQSSTTLAEDWQRLGFERKISGGRWYWHGLGLRAEYPLESQRG